MNYLYFLEMLTAVIRSTYIFNLSFRFVICDRKKPYKEKLKTFCQKIASRRIYGEYKEVTENLTR